LRKRTAIDDPSGRVVNPEDRSVGVRSAQLDLGRVSGERRLLLTVLLDAFEILQCLGDSSSSGA